MARLLLPALLAGANIFIPLAILLFAGGFFPYKPLIPGLARYEAGDFKEPPAAPFDRLIFMVVDALRSDFVYLENSGFQFTQELIRDGAAIPFTANARSPTVTMPRLKAITTGSIPSFLDAILNIDEGDTTSSLSAQDSWIAQMKAKQTGKLVMFGDDTWLKLFPDMFDRHDGTASFFVSDFTEVDHNVTRNIAGELKKEDWNTMILHYLGLDHIGHKSGPRSSNMFPKQREMDDIVKELYSAMQDQNHLSSTLLVLCGDHGMNDAGNHGASSPGETSPALLFISPKLQPVSTGHQSPVPFKEDFRYYSMVEQSDLAPTLAGLLGFPVPQNNLGAFIPDFLPLWKRADQVQLLVRNTRQILAIATAAFGKELFEPDAEPSPCVDVRGDAQRLACDLRLMNEKLQSISSYNDVPPEWLDQAIEWLRSAQDLMSNMASNYDMPKLILGQVVGVVSCGLATAALFESGIVRTGSFTPFAAIALSYGIMMFASSYVEEEHHFWYWATSAWLGFLLFKQRPRIGTRTMCLWSVAVLGATRLIRGWNQTGQKFAGAPDIVKTFILTNPKLLWFLVATTYAWLQGRLMSGFDSLPRSVTAPAVGLLVFAAFAFKLAFTNEDSPELVVGPLAKLNGAMPSMPLVSRARLVFAGVVLLASYTTFAALRGGPQAKRAFETLHHLYTLIALTQSRVTNIPLFILHAVQFNFLAASRLSAPEVAISTLLLQHASYFAFGGTNAISSVDLSSAYNGVSDFNVVAVGVLTFASNWAGPIYWTSAATSLLLRSKRRDDLGKKEEEHGGLNGAESVFGRHAAVLTAFVAWSVLFVMVACTVLRTHLFIWTVFSPKYLYCMAWSLGQHLAVNLGLGGVLYFIGKRAAAE